MEKCLLPKYNYLNSWRTRVYKSKYTTLAYNTAYVNVLKCKSTKTLGA